MNDYNQKKATFVILGTIVVVILILVIPSLIFNSEKEEKKNFPNHTNIDIKNTSDFSQIKRELENDYNFRKEVLITDYNYENYTSIDIQNLLWNYIFSYELNNTRYLSSISDTKFCMREQYVIDSFKELYNVDITKDLNKLPGYYKYVTKKSRRYCFNFKNVSLEYNNDIRIGIKNLDIKDDIVTADMYLYEFYIMNTDSEMMSVNSLDGYIASSNYSQASDIVISNLAGKVTHKEIKFKINNKADFYKYQILSSKNVDN